MRLQLSCLTSCLTSGLTAVAVAALLTACGGGGGGSDPAADNRPSQTLQDNDTVAMALATEAHASVRAAGRVPGEMGTAQLTGLVTTLGQGNNVGGKLTVPCAVAGSISADFPAALSGLTTGKTYSVSFNSCEQVAGMVTSGQISLSFTSLVNSNNFVETATYNITVTQAGSTTTYAGNQSCTVAAGVASCSFQDGQRSFGGSFSNRDGVLNGSYSWTYGSAQNINFDFSNWSNTGGSISVNGPDKFRATVTRDGPSSYTITINGGVPRKVTLPG
jgi:hypothetical protein